MITLAAEDLKAENNFDHPENVSLKGSTLELKSGKIPVELKPYSVIICPDPCALEGGKGQGIQVAQWKKQRFSGFVEERALQRRLRHTDQYGLQPLWLSFPNETVLSSLLLIYRTSTFSSCSRLSDSSVPVSSNEFVIAAFPFSTLVITYEQPIQCASS